VTVPPRSESLLVLHRAAYHGVCGDLVRMIAPCTEADPVGILACLLTAAGIMIGPGPYITLGQVRHPARINSLLVGATSKGRKGTAWANTENFVSSFDPYFVVERVKGGLSTGEGLIAALSGSKDDDEPSDKRLLVVESEFARVLAAAKREGATLSAILRQLYDSGRAAVMTRNDPLSITGAHVGIVGQIAPRELRVRLADSDLAGGLWNRFMILLVERPHLLTREVEPPLEIQDLVVELSLAIGKAAGIKDRLLRTPSADRMWDALYPALNEEGDDGLLGEVQARAPTNVMRVALIYAFLDGRTVIDVPHLRAAAALIRYTIDSAKIVFGHLTGHSDLDRLREFIEMAPAGRTKTEVHQFFAGNKSADAINALLRELETAGHVVFETDRTGRPGRPTQRVYPVGRTDALTRLLDESNEETD
jgi:Protein of unknown function (DUF3987)